MVGLNSSYPLNKPYILPYKTPSKGVPLYKEALEYARGGCPDGSFHGCECCERYGASEDGRQCLLQLQHLIPYLCIGASQTEDDWQGQLQLARTAQRPPASHDTICDQNRRAGNIRRRRWCMVLGTLRLWASGPVGRDRDV